MGYDHAKVRREVLRMLNAQPVRSLKSIAAELRVDRHTITRVLRASGTNFSQARQEALNSQMDSILGQSRPLLMKEVAQLLGCSSRTLRSRMARRQRAVSSRTKPAGRLNESDSD
jgi:hypothetical protein